MCTTQSRCLSAVLAVTSLAIMSLTGCHSMSGYAMNDSGRAYYARGNYAMARQEFQRAVADNPQNADYMSNLAAAMKKQGDLPGAERTYRQALQVDPSHQPSYHGLTKLLTDQGRTAEAADLLTAWSETQPYLASPHVELAWFHRNTGNTVAAETALRKALQVDPNHPTALAHLGQLYQDRGNHATAVAMYQRSLNSNWYQPQVQSRLATLQGTSRATQTPRVASNPWSGFYRAQAAPTAPPQLGLRYPLPAYRQATIMPGASTAAVQGRPVAQQHYGVQVARPATSARPVTYARPQQARPTDNADPAHVPQLSARIPTVSAF